MKFEFSKVKDFDRHIELSIPNYQTLSNVFSGICTAFAQPETSVIDIGCSTGRFLDSLPDFENVDLIGIDNQMQPVSNKIEFINIDVGLRETIIEFTKEPSVFVSMFTLQFLGSPKRKNVLRMIKKYVDNGAIFLVAEKVHLANPKIEMLIHRMHIQEKRKNFTDKEILKKDSELMMSMYCLTLDDLFKELSEVGIVSQVWQSYNFVGYAVQKK